MATNSFYGNVAVATAGTAVQVAPALGYTKIVCSQIAIIADPGNSGKIYLGMGSDVSSAKYIVPLSAGDSYVFNSGNAPEIPCQDIWINTDVNGSKVGAVLLPGFVLQ